MASKFTSCDHTPGPQIFQTVSGGLSSRQVDGYIPGLKPFSLGLCQAKPTPEVSLKSKFQAGRL